MLTRPANMLKATKLADREAAVDDELGAKKQDAGGDQLAHELDRLARHIAEAEHPEACRDIARELLLPAALHLRLDRHRLERLDAGHALHQKGLVLGAARKLLVEPAPEQRRRSGRNRDIERECAEHDEGQERRVHEHHRQEHEGEEQIDDQRERRAGEKVADIFKLAHARNRVADPPRLEIGDRQGHQMAEQPGAQLDVDPVGRMRKKISAQDAEDGLENRNRHQPDDQHIERAQRAMHQHLVDDHLKEQRRDQREQLQKERGDEHLAEQAAGICE